MWALRPASYHNHHHHHNPHYNPHHNYDNDSPIDLRKKVVLQRDPEHQKALVAPRPSPPPPEDRWRPQLPLGNLYPFMSERYGVRCALVQEVQERPSDLRVSAGRGTLESAIRKLHSSSRMKHNYSPPEPSEERSRSAELLRPRKDRIERNRPQRPLARSHSCPDLTSRTQPPSDTSKSRHLSGYSSDGSDPRPHRPRTPPRSPYAHLEAQLGHRGPPGGAKKRKCFVPTSGTPPPPLDPYYRRPEVILRQQLQQQQQQPYLLHVYDYYQQLVQRLRGPVVVSRGPPSPPSPETEGPPSDVQRKRPCRALTGKHVKQGTGASLSTLLTLRQKIQERQKAREQQPVHMNGNGVKNASPKKNAPKKPKPIVKNAMSKLNNY